MWEEDDEPIIDATTIYQAKKALTTLINDEIVKARSRVLNDITVWANQEMVNNHLAQLKDRKE